MRAKWFLLPFCLAALMLLPACASMNEEKEEMEEDSTAMTLDQLPPAVRKTVEAQAAGNKIEEIEREISAGKTTYEAEVTVNGKEHEIIVAEDGTLISNQEDKEDKD